MTTKEVAAAWTQTNIIVIPIKFKLAVVVYRALHGTAPLYLSDQLQYVADLPTRHREVACARRLPVFLKSARHDVSLSAITHLPLPAHDSGTVYLMMSSLPHRSQHFAENWKLIYFGSHTRTLYYSLVAIVVPCSYLYLGHYKYFQCKVM